MSVAWGSAILLKCYVSHRGDSSHVLCLIAMSNEEVVMVDGRCDAR